MRALDRIEPPTLPLPVQQLLAELIADLSKFYHLQPGDLLYTGTPAGVGPIAPGDRLVGTIDGLAPVELAIGPAE